MASQMNTKIRLVRCPKCHLVLPELPEITVYKCGGCNTVLEAKHRKPDNNETGDTETRDNSDNINMKQPEDADFLNETRVSSGQDCFKYRDSSTVKKNQTELDKKKTISCQDTGKLENHVPGDENTAWDRGIRVCDDSMELTSVEIDVTSLDEDRYDDTDRFTEADEISSHNANRGYSKDGSFFSDVAFVMTDSSPESGLNNKQNGKSVHLSRHHRAGSNIVQSVRGKAKREADELFKAWTFKGLRAQESDSLSNLPTAKPRFEQGVTCAEFPKSSTRKCYRCNGSFSCNDGMCDQGPSRTLNPPRRMCCNESGALNMKDTKHNHENFRETRDYGLCRTRPQNEDYVPRNNFQASCCQVHSYGLCSPDTPLSSGPDKLELLKMIDELKDELKRTRISNIGFPSRISGEQMNYVSHEPRVSRMGCLGHHGTTVQCCLNHNGHTFYKGSSSLSPCHQLYAGHQFLHRDRDSSSKRYLRPTAGGIPFVSCYHCSELLQLPADFLVFGRKYHKLRCNACRRTMKFSIQGKGHLVPNITDTVAPPPSMVDDYSDSRSDSRDMRRKNSVDTIELTGKKNGKELSPKSEAALHRLMGYSSLSQVIRPHRKSS